MVDNTMESMKAQKHMEAGEKALKKWSLFSSSSKYENAIESFTKAANSYKIAKEWELAANTWERIANLHIKLASTHEAATSFNEAAQCLKKCNSPDTITMMNKSIELYSELGRFNQMARMYNEIGEMHEASHELQEALNCFSQAADYFEAENQNQRANTARTKVAVLSSTDPMEDFLTAAEIFEQIGRSCLGNRLLAANARGYFLQAGLCYLATGDQVKARQKLEEFNAADYTFETMREGQFFSNLLQAVEGFDLDGFTDHCFKYDNITKLDPWKTSILVKIKRTIQQEDTDDVEIDLT